MNLNIATNEDITDLRQEFMAKLEELKEAQNRGSKKFLRSAEVRKMFSISAGTLQGMRAKGVLPYSRVGTTILYDRDKIVEVFNKNKVD